MAQRLRGTRTALALVAMLVVANGYTEMRVVLFGAAASQSAYPFLLLRLMALAWVALTWWAMRRIRKPRALDLLEMSVLAIYSLMFWLNLSANTNQNIVVNTAKVPIYCLFIYLLMSVPLRWITLAAAPLSLASWWVWLEHLPETYLVPGIPVLLMCAVVNIVSWVHYRHRQQVARELFASRETLRERLAQESTLVERQEQFIAMLAHELRNPLAVIRAETALAKLRNVKGLPNDPDITDRIRDMVLRIQRVFDGLMARERSLTRDDALSPEDLKLYPWLVDEFVPTLEAQDHPVLIKAHHARVVVRCDPTLLQLVLSNLCSNAIKFSPAGRPIELSLRARPNEIGIRVRDHGEGIAPEAREAIFQKYVRQPQHQGIEGYGFGLFMARRLTQQMGGRIQLQSVVGRGSAFTVWLPRSTPA